MHASGTHGPGGWHGGPAVPSFLVTGRRRRQRAPVWHAAGWKKTKASKRKKWGRRRDVAPGRPAARRRPAAASPCAAGTARPAPGGPRPAPARGRRRRRERRAERPPALRGRRFAGLASPGVPWSKVRLSNDESGAAPHELEKWLLRPRPWTDAGCELCGNQQRVRLC